MSGPTRLIRGTHHAHAATPDQRLHRRPPAPARHCGICGARLRASNPDRLCAPCDTREQARLADTPEALRRGDVQDALAFIAAMDVKRTRTRYDLRRHGRLSATHLAQLLERPWSGVVALALATHPNQEAA